jgi:hypothetical protein
MGGTHGTEGLDLGYREIWAGVRVAGARDESGPPLGFVWHEVIGNPARIADQRDWLDEGLRHDDGHGALQLLWQGRREHPLQSVQHRCGGMEGNKCLRPGGDVGG